MECGRHDAVPDEVVDEENRILWFCRTCANRRWSIAGNDDQVDQSDSEEAEDNLVKGDTQYFGDNKAGDFDYCIQRPADGPCTCGRIIRTDSALLVCEGCNIVRHVACLAPGSEEAEKLNEVAADKSLRWFCDECTKADKPPTNADETPQNYRERATVDGQLAPWCVKRDQGPCRSRPSCKTPGHLNNSQHGRIGLCKLCSRPWHQLCANPPISDERIHGKTPPQRCNWLCRDCRNAEAGKNLADQWQRRAGIEAAQAAGDQNTADNARRSQDAGLLVASQTQQAKRQNIAGSQQEDRPDREQLPSVSRQDLRQQRRSKSSKKEKKTAQNTTSLANEAGSGPRTANASSEPPLDTQKEEYLGGFPKPNDECPGCGKKPTKSCPCNRCGQRWHTKCHYDPVAKAGYGTDDCRSCKTSPSDAPKAGNEPGDSRRSNAGLQPTALQLRECCAGCGRSPKNMIYCMGAYCHGQGYHVDNGCPELDIPDEILGNNRSNYHWSCYRCTAANAVRKAGGQSVGPKRKQWTVFREKGPCIACGEHLSSDQGVIVDCVKCERAWHQKCHEPNIDNGAGPGWRCADCIDGDDGSLDGTVDNETEDEAGPEDDVATDEEDSGPQDGDNTDAAMQSAPLDLKRPQPDHCTERLSTRDRCYGARRRKANAEPWPLPSRR
ncbi:hypothetical protein LTS18_003899 [Coniosporium uncinatum]|uniref:Uncharacterized protein n=1 Tax=Coniosporium uncinatum TaxID=93489 RepID=A0ACC3DYQ0_9PEZI|nr:hypothetical protein LTS18_003899 [Coniosporium uncinatum]